MKPNPVHRLPAALESAVQRIKLAARAATERTIESLGLAALASGNVFQRDGLLGAQFELNRKSAVFALAFNDDFDARVARDVTPKGDGSAGGSDWGALSLVEDRELELEVAAERFGMDIAHACEWELRELAAYLVPLLGDAAERNPLRPELVGHAMVRAIDAVSDRPEVAKVLTTELGRSLGGLLRGAYADIVADLRNAGLQPVGLTVRTTEQRGTAPAATQAAQKPETPDVPQPPSVAGALEGRGGRRGFGPSTRSGASSRGAPLGAIDPALMSVIRRLAYGDGGGETGGFGDDSGVGGGLPNLIRAHRDELRQASGGALDHMVIDVIGSLFDQILSDPKVPPQIARQIARLQLPVLRAALGDPSFFSSRRHPVRRFVNRIASLGSAFDDVDEAGARDVLAKVRELVQEVVEGDFDQIAVYDRKLQALEAFVAEQGRREVQSRGDAAELLAAREDEQRLRQLYAQQLEGDFKDLAAPGFVRDFIAQVWSRVLLRAAERDGPDGDRVQRLRHVGRELFMSVQAKTSAQQRKAFLAELPKLMKDLGDGMDLIGWPDADRRAFFGQLLPAHGEALKAKELRALDFNLLARQVDGALERPLPSKADTRLASLPVLTDAVAPALSADEARRVGLVDEAAVDWNAPVDIDLGAEPPLTAADVQLPGLPPSVPAPDAPEPVAGKSLADHMQIGCAYQMLIDAQWQKVRLLHVSPARSFFVFHHGGRHKQTISLTHRMLVRLCDSGRLRAFESAYLLERAQARARRQLASVGGA